VDTKAIYRYNIEEMLAYIIANKARAKRTEKGDVLMWVPVTTDIIEKLQ